MCIVLCPVEAGDEIEIVFAFERVLHLRDGGKTVTMDNLVQNLNKSSHIRTLRMVYPDPLVDIASAENQDERKAGMVISKLRNLQFGTVSVATEDLADPGKRQNWIYYGINPHVRYDPDNKVPGIFAIIRTTHASGP